MQPRLILRRFYSFFKFSILLLGTSVVLAPSVPASTSFLSLDSKVWQSEQFATDPRVLDFLKKAEDTEKFLFFQEAFNRQKLTDFNQPADFLGDDFPLKSYVSAWSLLAQSKAEPENKKLQSDIQTFIQQNKNDYIAERVRTDWLLMMAPIWLEQKQWKTFQSIRSQLQWNKFDSTIVCWDLLHQIDSKKNLSKTFAQDTLEIINSPKYKGNAVCKKVSTELINKTPSTAFTRLVVLIQQGRIADARGVLNVLIRKKRLPAQASRLAFNQPSKWYRVYRHKLSRQNKHVRLIAAYRLTSVNIDWAVRVAESVHGKLNKAERSALWGCLGYVAALSHNPKALSWYDRGGASVCSGPYSATPKDCLEWRARAALRAKDWKKLDRYIATMPAGLANGDNWNYWRARALAETGQKERAKKYWQRIQSVRTFYGKLAAEALGKRFYYTGNETVEATSKAIDAAGRVPSLKRAQMFYDLGLIVEGNREWQWGIQKMTAAELLAAAQWAEEQKFLHRAINTAIKVAERYPVKHDLLYPRPFEDEIEDYAESAEIDVNWVYGLMRQESRFIAAARSSVGANGLMQIMPATAKWIAKELEVEDFKPEKIYEIETNIYFGTAYLRSLLNRLGNNMILATAGYNAGPNRASRWQSSLSSITEGAIFIETIPFTETRNYVQNVLANTVEYAHEEGQELSSFRQWLGDIDPENKTTVEENI